jgi:Uncharacterized protein conserved in bacteria
LLLAAPLACAGDISGYWLTPVPHHRDAVIQIYRNGDLYDGKLVAFEQPDYTAAEHPDLAGKPKMDLHNPDAAKRNRPLKGLVVLRGLKPDGANHWDDAHIYNPRNGKTYDAQATLSDDGRTLHLRGYILFSLLGQTQDWQRIDGPDYFQSHHP